MRFHRSLFSAAALFLMSGPLQAASGAGYPSIDSMGMCKKSIGAGACTCSLANIETPMSFAEAAGVLERSHDPSYVDLIGLMLEECSSSPTHASLNPYP
jgi:hypothetical protein